jgi:hypothetical protein
VVEDEEALGEFVKGLEVVSESSLVAVGGEDAVAETVDRGDAEFGEVGGASKFGGSGRDAVAEFEGGFLGERAEDYLFGCRATRKDEIQRPEHQAEGLAGTGAGNDEEGTVGVGNDLLLGVV